MTQWEIFDRIKSFLLPYLTGYEIAPADQYVNISPPKGKKMCTMTVITDNRSGYTHPEKKVDFEAGKITDAIHQYYETGIQLTFFADGYDCTSDARIASNLLQSHQFVAYLKQVSVYNGLQRVTSVRSLPQANDSNRYVIYSSFDVTISHRVTVDLSAPVSIRTELTIKSV